MMRLFIGLIFIGLLSGYMSACVNAPPVDTSGMIYTPPLVTYTNDYEKAAAVEMREAAKEGKYTHLREMVTDYLKLRCAIRWAPACAKLVPDTR